MPVATAGGTLLEEVKIVRYLNLRQKVSDGIGILKAGPRFGWRAF